MDESNNMSTPLRQLITIALPLPGRADLENRYRKVVDAYEKALHEMQRRLLRDLKRLEISPTVKYRVKSFQSYYEKLLRRARKTQNGETCIEITDLLGIRIVCPFIEDLSLVEERIRAIFNVTEVERKGAEFSFKEFGYESTHYLVTVPQDIVESVHVNAGLVCEVQLRTILQDAWAEVEHELVYKSEFTPFDEPLRRKLAALNANLSLADMIFQEIREYQRRLHTELEKRRDSFWTKIRAVDSEQLHPPQSGPSADVRFSELTGTGTIDELLLKGLLAHNDGSFVTAIEHYDRILGMTPRPAIQAVVHIHRGMAHFGLSHYDRAVADFSRTLELEPENFKAYYYRAVVHKIHERYSDAVRDFSACLDLDPYQYDALLGRAQVLDALGRADDALADCSLALKIAPESPEACALRDKIASRGTP
ncbi:MAG: (p)ppGpp synthetase [Spirochaetaceae bacterium]|nr:MAG: (p)ppGpp synthetase [Spirochaetaceae bacterium]